MNIIDTLKEQLGEIKPEDRYHFQLLCDSWKTYLDAKSHILTNGMIIHSGQRLYVNPAINVANESFKQIIKLSKLFGIQPNSRLEASAASDDWTQALE